MSSIIMSEITTSHMLPRRKIVFVAGFVEGRKRVIRPTRARTLLMHLMEACCMRFGFVSRMYQSSCEIVWGWMLESRTYAPAVLFEEKPYSSLTSSSL